MENAAAFVPTQVRSGAPPTRDEPLTTAALDPVVRDAAQGDSYAIRTLTAMITPLMARYCRARLGRRDFAYICADDVAQDICVAVLQALLPIATRAARFCF